MSEDIRRIRDDISFIRTIMEDDGSVLRASGVGLLVAGTVFGLAALRSFALASGWLHWPQALQPFLAWDAPAAFFLVLLPVLATMSRGRSAQAAALSSTSRAVWASWAAVGIGYAVAAVSLSLAGSHAAESVLFAFWGCGWFIAAAAYRRARFALVALGCYLVALGTGLLSGGPYEALLMAVALWVLVALPGLMVLKQARAVA
jgi:hypothetical protein